MRRREIHTVIQLKDEQKKQLMEEIKAFYLDVRGDEIGMIEQQQIFDLFMEQLAPVVYNKALDDARRWYRNQQERMEEDYYLMYREI